MNEDTLCEIPDAMPTPKETLFISKKVPKWGTCPRCQHPALKCHDGYTDYFRCAFHELVLPDGTSYPAIYSREWHQLHGTGGALMQKTS